MSSESPAVEETTNQPCLKFCCAEKQRGPQSPNEDQGPEERTQIHHPSLGNDGVNPNERSPIPALWFYTRFHPLDSNVRLARRVDRFHLTVRAGSLLL